MRVCGVTTPRCTVFACLYYYELYQRSQQQPRSCVCVLAVDVCSVCGRGDVLEVARDDKMMYKTAAAAVVVSRAARLVEQYAGLDLIHITASGAPFKRLFGFTAS